MTMMRVIYRSVDGVLVNNHNKNNHNYENPIRMCVQEKYEKGLFSKDVVNKIVVVKTDGCMEMTVLELWQYLANWNWKKDNSCATWTRFLVRYDQDLFEASDPEDARPTGVSLSLHEIIRIDSSSVWFVVVCGCACAWIYYIDSIQWKLAKYSAHTAKSTQ